LAKVLEGLINQTSNFCLVTYLVDADLKVAAFLEQELILESLENGDQFDIMESKYADLPTIWCRERYWWFFPGSTLGSPSHCRYIDRNGKYRIAGGRTSFLRQNSVIALIPCP
jgi:hypothetical protein